MTALASRSLLSIPRTVFRRCRWGNLMARGDRQIPRFGFPFPSRAFIRSGVTNTIAVQFADNAQPAHTNSATFTYVEAPYTTIPPGIALPATAVDTTQRGFLYRIHQIDSTDNGALAANIAHAEAQLAGLLAPPGGQPYQNVAGAGTQPDGSFVVTDAINFSLDTTAPEGAFTIYV